MKIAQIPPPADSVLHRRNGGPQRVVSYLAEELARLGHDVTLFPARDAAAGAKLALEQAAAGAREFDVLHVHADPAQLRLLEALGARALVTVHGMLSEAPAGGLALVSVSRAQQDACAGASWAGRVYHGLAPDVYPFNPAFGPGAQDPYLAFLRGPSDDTGLAHAAEIARRSDLPLRVADDDDEAGKVALLGHAAALVAPVSGRDPFPLALIESMSCGTPVIAAPLGAAPEVVDEGLTGCLAESVAAAARAARRIAGLNRRLVRQRFEERFTAARMARDYLSLYRALGRRRQRVRTDPVPAAL